MEQIVFVLTEYVGEIAAGMGAFAIILLVTALHRIRRIEKYIQGIAGNPVLSEENIRGQAVESSETANADKAQKMASPEVADAEGIQEASCPSAQRLPQNGNQYREGKQGQNAPKTPSPGELIDEVLGEVFL